MARRARALLEGAIAYARNAREDAEAYPVDRPVRSSDEATWFGAKLMYDDAGFREVEDAGGSAVVRRSIAEAKLPTPRRAAPRRERRSRRTRH